MKIKVCGNTTIQDAAFLLQQDVEYAGFIFYPKSARYVGEDPNPALFRATGHAIKNVGVFVNAPADAVIGVVRNYGLDLVQLHGTETPSYCRKIKNDGIEIIKAFGVDDNFDPAVTDDYSHCADYFLFDTASGSYGGTGRKFNWQVLDDFNSPLPYFLSGGIGPDDADEILTLRLPELYAIDINSKFEVKPGIKNHQLLSLFLEKMRTLKK